MGHGKDLAFEMPIVKSEFSKDLYDLECVP